MTPFALVAAMCPSLQSPLIHKCGCHIKVFIQLQVNYFIIFLVFKPMPIFCLKSFSMKIYRPVICVTLLKKLSSFCIYKIGQRLANSIFTMNTKICSFTQAQLMRVCISKARQRLANSVFTMNRKICFS